MLFRSVQHLHSAGAGQDGAHIGILEQPGLSDDGLGHAHLLGEGFELGELLDLIVMQLPTCLLYTSGRW